MRFSRSEWLWLPLVVAAVLAIYLPGLGNVPLFDDEYLTSGRLAAEYASLLELRARLLSYATYRWVQDFLGDGYWKQRLVNVGFHLATVIALWGMYREIIRHLASPAGDPGDASPPPPYANSPSLGLAVALFALNPVAVYAVAYLMQRSIIMATFFVVVSLWLFARGLATGRTFWFALALVSYVLGIFSKEHALFAPLAAIPVYILVARPSGKRLATLALTLLVLAGVAGLALWSRYGAIIGKPFDEYSHVYLAQLAKLNPDAPANAFGLSILNQAWLFFEYGLRWLVPWTGWMSINLRPPFPVNWGTFPQLLGIVGYLATLVGGFVLLIRYRDGRALVGGSLVIATLLFATEFLTVWVQDPFVLYRSYIWAIALPGLVIAFAHGASGRALLAIGSILGVLLIWQSLDRVYSLATPERAWSDAIAKLPDDPRSVGRWFPYLNRGADRFERDQLALAQRDFETSAALGDLGMGAMNLGSLLSSKGKHAQALAAFNLAERQGYNLYNLSFQRGLAFQALNRAPDAYREFTAARASNAPSPTRELIDLQLGRSAMHLGKTDEAISLFEGLVAKEPANREARYNLGMAYVAKGSAQRAVEVLDKLIAEDANGRAYYARALANYALKRKKEALEDIGNAMRIIGATPHLQEWQVKIQALS
ncbi:tetratricopeptide repeat protein [Usitatibacter palustris]|uniref:Uncharacterized protein n=1 Tax=Usitatibacter palustris TaxID=2732487 RepID=A0A6M4HDB9_9PROT|nr:tetratricopeptide repeat protein [Usitatibacter palustris]QJR16533.1 hypothetical protein DSM104440_03368 [Usitatibacter palustris]